MAAAANQTGLAERAEVADATASTSSSGAAASSGLRSSTPSTSVRQTRPVSAEATRNRNAAVEVKGACSACIARRACRIRSPMSCTEVGVGRMPSPRCCGTKTHSSISTDATNPTALCHHRAGPR